MEEAFMPFESRDQASRDHSQSVKRFGATSFNVLKVKLA
jgi:hypothetical protein